MGTSINDVTQFEGKIDSLSPSVTNTWSQISDPLPILPHKLIPPPLKKAMIIACRNKSDFNFLRQL